MVKPFNIDIFSDNTPDKAERKRTEFVNYFSSEPEPQLPIPPEEKMEVEDETIDIENEARKVFEEAFAQGEKAGREMGMKRTEPLLKRLNNDIALLDSFKNDLMEKAERLTVELALSFAEAIVLKECEEKRYVVSDMAKKALALCEDKSGITIRVRKEDFQYVTHNIDGAVKVVSDETLKEPGFIIETNFGDIDGLISTQLEELKREFLHGD